MRPMIMQGPRMMQSAQVMHDTDSPDDAVFSGDAESLDDWF